MFAQLLMAVKTKGASEGKPVFVTQALGIPLVALVFVGLRLQLLMLAYGFDFFSAVQHIQWMDWVMLSACIWMYSSDFFFDVLHWDERGVSLQSWQVAWALFWGLLPFLGFYLLAFLGLFSFRFPAFTGASIHQLFIVLGGIGYLIVRRFKGKVAALMGSFLIAFTFASALFWDASRCFEVAVWWQGLLVFWLNVLVMQWFERDKDAMSDSVNVWLLISSTVLGRLCAALVLTIFVIWIFNPYKSWGVLLLLLLYGLMRLWPGNLRWARLYRLLVDGALLLWLL